MVEPAHASPHQSAPKEVAVFQTRLPLPGRRQGKVRDVYEMPATAGHAPRILVVASDRISAFDVVMPTPIPGKGRLLTDISLAWFERIRAMGIVADHLVGTDLSALPALTDAERAQLAGRSMVCRAARVVPIECVARGYLAGSGWVEYQASGTVCGIALPAGMTQCQELPEPIFTPATKAETGHDENISFDQACEAVGGALMEELRARTLEIFKRASRIARDKGVILADTKFEFGHALDAHSAPTGELLLIDEVLTPDSSRYWPADGYAPGRDQPSFDKQFVRNWLLQEVAAKRWNKEAPGPELPAEIVSATVARYREAARLLCA
jgi:phosphoribosylaminoimidazole-succinocarboxamide synthase